MKLYFSSGYRFFIWLQIGLQFIFPIIATIPISVMAEESPPPLAYSNVITEVAQSLSSDAQNPVKNTATSLIVGESSSVAEKWLGQFGTARISLDVDEHGNWDRSSFDFLYPIYDNEKSLLFTQLGARAPNGRITGNLGLGVRTYHDNNWMFGGNVFFDHDFTGENRRVGIGAEAWTDYLKLSANTYVGTSDWHTSHDFDNYNEKPADGFDIRVETYIPSLPQVGVKGMYEQYYGNEVALFNKEHKQRNPSAITTGLTYTPIPMITTGVDYRLGQQSQDEFKFTLNFRYELGSSLQSQLSPEQVGSYRTLAGSRYNLVERNNEIILQYKEKPQTRTLADISISSVKDNSPADGISQNIVTVHAVDSNGQAIKNIPIIWSIEGDGKLSNYSGITDNNGNLSVAITNTVIEKSLVTAKTGSLIRTIPTNFTDAVATLELSSLKDGAVANGSEQNISQVVVKDSNGNALSDIPINWKLNNGAKITYSDQITNNEGKALVKFTNISVGSVSVDAQSGEHIGKTTASFVEIPVGTLQVSMLSNNAPADGASENTAQVVVLDKNGKALPDVEVNWTLSGNAVATTPLSVITGADGIAKVRLTDTSVEAVTVSAQARGQSGKTTASFVEIPVGTLQVSMLSNNAPADGASENTAQVVVLDKNGKALPDVEVNWTLSGNAVATTPLSVITGADGIAKVSLTDTSVEAVTVSAQARGQSGKTTASFVEIPVGTLQVSMLSNNAPADGASENTAQVVVLDKNGKVLPDVEVNWTLSGNAVATTPLSVITGSDGIAKVSLTDTSVEVVTVSAQARGQSGFTSAKFDNIKVASITLESTGRGYKADPGVVTATVIDKNGNPVSGVNITWDTPALGNHFLTCSNIGTVSDIQGQASYTCYTQGGTVSQMPFKVSVSSDFAEDPANPPSDSLTRNYFLN